jgi:hypothetical protein
MSKRKGSTRSYQTLPARQQRFGQGFDGFGTEDRACQPSYHAEHQDCTKTYSANTHTLTRQTDSIYCLTHSNGDGLFLQLFVDSDQELRVHSCDQPVHHPVCLVKYDCQGHRFSNDAFRAVVERGSHDLDSVNATRSERRPLMAEGDRICLSL